MKPSLKATIFSSLSFGSSLTIYYLFFTSNDVWFMLSMISGYFILPLPFLLIFTIKQKETKKSVVQPPRALQFHNEDLSNSGISYPLQFHENFDNQLHSSNNELEELKASKLLQSKPWLNKSQNLMTKSFYYKP